MTRVNQGKARRIKSCNSVLRTSTHKLMPLWKTYNSLFSIVTRATSNYWTTNTCIAWRKHPMAMLSKRSLHLRNGFSRFTRPHRFWSKWGSSRPLAGVMQRGIDDRQRKSAQTDWFWMIEVLSVSWIKWRRDCSHRPIPEQLKMASRWRTKDHNLKQAITISCALQTTINLKQVKICSSRKRFEWHLFRILMIYYKIYKTYTNYQLSLKF